MKEKTWKIHTVRAPHIDIDKFALNHFRWEIALTPFTAVISSVSNFEYIFFSKKRNFHKVLNHNTFNIVKIYIWNNEKFKIEF